MLEIEVKIDLGEHDENVLIAGADFVSKREITDAYYDRDDYVLTRADTWLRKRNGKFELKVPASDVKQLSQRVVDNYIELVNDEEIRKYLGLSRVLPLADVLALAGYKSFVVMKTIRRKYKNGDFTIDLDTTDYGYNLAEVELMIEENGDKQAAEKRILDFVRGLGLNPEGKGKGKLIDYIKRFRPEHYKILVEAGVI